MRIDGEWVLFEDGEVRPCVPGFVFTADGNWVGLPFLLDAGADRTVLSARFLDLLRPLEKPQAEPTQLAGVGGQVGSINVDTQIGFKSDAGRLIKVRGSFGVFTEFESSDLSVLGRDVTNNFKVIYDYPDQAVILLAHPHRYEIETDR